VYKRQAKGEIVVFLDDDGVLEPNGLMQIWREFNEDDELGIITGKVVDYFTGQIQKSYWPFPAFQLRYAESRFEAVAYSGGLHAVRKKIFDAVGLYDSLLFFALEERGLALRCLSAGYKIVYEPKIVFRHKGKARGGWDGSRFFWQVRGRLLVAALYYPFPYVGTRLLEYLAAFLVQALRNGWWGPYFKAIAAALSLSVKVIPMRTPISKKAFRKVARLEKRQRGPLSFRLSHELFRLRRNEV